MKKLSNKAKPIIAIALVSILAICVSFTPIKKAIAVTQPPVTVDDLNRKSAEKEAEREARAAGTNVNTQSATAQQNSQANNAAGDDKSATKKSDNQILYAVGGGALVIILLGVLFILKRKASYLKNSIS